VWWAGRELQGEVVDGKEEASRGRLVWRIDVPTLAKDAALLLARAASIGLAVVVYMRGWWLLVVACSGGKGGEVENRKKSALACDEATLPAATGHCVRYERA